MRNLYFGPSGGLHPSKEQFDEYFSKNRGPHMAQEKADGMWGCIYKSGGVIQISSRTDTYVDPRHKEDANTFAALNKWMPEDSIVIGEYGLISKAEREKSADRGYVTVNLYDILKWSGKSWTTYGAYDRFRGVESLLDRSTCEREIIRVIPTIYLENSPENWKENSKEAWEYFERVQAAGGEGIMMKPYNLAYSPGKKSKQMIRVKKHYSLEYVCVGFDPTTIASYIEQGITVACIQCGLYVNGALTHVTSVSSGLILPQKKDFSDHPEKYIGRVLEVSGNELWGDGTILRHPVFHGWRDDKRAEECVPYQGYEVKK